MERREDDIYREDGVRISHSGNEGPGNKINRESWSREVQAWKSVCGWVVVVGEETKFIDKTQDILRLRSPSRSPFHKTLSMI